MRFAPSLLVGCVALAATPASAQQIVTSKQPQAINVTVYRDPGRSGGGEINLQWLNGFALITETRTIALPRGESQIRFEGVADGIVAVSAVVTGLPGGVVQKNRDAALLSPAALLDGTLGNRVTVRRTNKATGNVELQQAVIRSGPAGAVVLETANGVESLRCSGLPETLIYQGVPKGLSAKPTLSVLARSPRAQTARVTLTYLASGFDWAANYVATVRPDGKSVDLFAWLTVANSNSVTMPQAQMMAVAGTLNKERDYRELVTPQAPPQLNLRCYPMGSGRNGIPRTFERYEAEDYLDDRYPPPPPPVMAPAPAEIAVTGARIARQEDLGDLKLYRVPMKVTVAAKQQKQVALLQKQAVPFERVYKGEIWIGRPLQNISLVQVLRMKNEAAAGLGLPLPSGGVALFEQAGGKRLLAAQTMMRDHAVKEEVELNLGITPLVTYQQKLEDAGMATVILSNANAFPVSVELAVGADGAEVNNASQPLKRKNGRMTWFVTVPAKDTASLTYKAR